MRSVVIYVVSAGASQRDSLEESWKRRADRLAKGVSQGGDKHGKMSRAITVLQKKEVRVRTVESVGWGQQVGGPSRPVCQHRVCSG